MIRMKTRSDNILIPLIDVKRHLRIDSEFDDALIYGLIRSAQTAAEKYTSRAITENTYLYIESTDCLDYDRRYNQGLIDRRQLRVGTITEIVSIKTYDTQGTETAETLTDFTIINYDQFSEIIQKDGGSFPSGSRSYAPLEIEFKAGFTEATLPGTLKLAIMQLISLYYANRETVESGSVAELPFGVTSLLNMHRIESI